MHSVVVGCCYLPHMNSVGCAGYCLLGVIQRFVRLTTFANLILIEHHRYYACSNHGSAHTLHIFYIYLHSMLYVSYQWYLSEPDVLSQYATSRPNRIVFQLCEQRRDAVFLLLKQDKENETCRYSFDGFQINSFTVKGKEKKLTERNIIGTYC